MCTLGLRKRDLQAPKELLPTHPTGFMYGYTKKIIVALWKGTIEKLFMVAPLFWLCKSCEKKTRHLLGCGVKI